MKQKIDINQHIVITNPADFLRGHLHSCFSLFGSDSSSIPGWIDLGRFTFEAEIDLAEITEQTVAILDEEIEKERAAFAVKVAMLEKRKQEVLAIPAPTGAEAHGTV